MTTDKKRKKGQKTACSDLPFVRILEEFGEPIYSVYAKPKKEEKTKVINRVKTELDLCFGIKLNRKQILKKVSNMKQRVRRLYLKRQKGEQVEFPSALLLYYNLLKKSAKGRDIFGDDPTANRTDDDESDESTSNGATENGQNDISDSENDQLGDNDIFIEAYNGGGHSLNNETESKSSLLELVENQSAEQNKDKTQTQTIANENYSEMSLDELKRAVLMKKLEVYKQKEKLIAEQREFIAEQRKNQIVVNPLII